MIKLVIKLLLGIMVLSSSQGAFAFDMNPIDVDCWGRDFLCQLTKAGEKLKFPVHETMTLLAYDCYEKPDACKGGIANTSAETLKKSGTLRDSALGSEWNDDPDSLLRQNITKAIEWVALIKDAKLQSECKEHPKESRCKGVKITQNPMMLYRSHFGDMQFLHSMASTRDEITRITKEKMMAWAKFTYRIFISEKNLDNQDISAFSEISGMINKPGWTVGALFDPVPGGKWKPSLHPLKLGHYEPSGKPRVWNSGDGISVKYIALGSLLHMIQDSYCESHVLRESGCNPIARNKGKIIVFRNYAGQKGDDHSIADVCPEWLKHGELPGGNPVWASAQIIKFAFGKESWENVETFLDKEVFPLKDTQAKPEPGDRNCFEGK